jgi:hypothetical protein
MITDLEIRLAEHVIDASGIVDVLLGGRQRSNRGRPTDPTPYRLFLLGGLLNVSTRGNFVIEDVHTTLTQRLSLDHQFRLKIRRKITRRDGTEEIRILSVHDLYNVTKNLDRFLAYGPGSAPELEDSERDRRHRVVTEFCDALMGVFDLGFTSTSYAIDATGIWSWGKGAHRRPKTDGDITDDSELPGEDDDAVEAA